MAGASTGTFTFGHLAVRGVSKIGHVAGQLSLAGAAVGTTPTNHASGTLTVAGSAAGHTDHSGTAPGASLAVSGAAHGTVTMAGTHSGTFTVAASPVRGVAAVGRASGTFTLAAAPAGTSDPSMAGGGFAFDGAADGSSPNHSEQVWDDGYYDPVAGVWIWTPFLFTFTGSAAGSRPPGTGTGSVVGASFAFAGSAGASSPSHGYAGGTHDWAVDYAVPHADLDLDAAYGDDRFDAPALGTDRFGVAPGTDRWDSILSPEKGSNR